MRAEHFLYFNNSRIYGKSKLRSLESRGWYIFYQWETHLTALKLRPTWEKTNTDTPKIYVEFESLDIAV